MSLRLNIAELKKRENEASTERQVNISVMNYGPLEPLSFFIIWNIGSCLGGVAVDLNTSYTAGVP